MNVPGAEARMDEALDALNREGNIAREYMEALEVVPHLVNTETDRLKFLRREEYDPIKAAFRLVTYWKYRKEVFGKRWLLPMVQTGAGCLSGESIDLLRKGFITLLSNPGIGPVIMIDSTRRTGPTADHTVASIAFYFATTVADESYCTPGVTLFYLIAERGHWNVSPMPTRYWKIVHDALPMKIKKILVVPYHDPGRQHLLDYLSFQTSRLVESRSKQSPQIVAADSLLGTIELLKGMGISQESLPNCLGGDFNDNHVHQWIRSRISLEDAMSAASPILNQIHAPRGSSDMLIKRKKPPVGSTGAEDAASEKDYIRQRNALYSRRKYHKEKLEKIALEEQAKALSERNDSVRADNEYLSSLLEQATGLLLSSSSPQHNSSSSSNHGQEQQQQQEQIIQHSSLPVPMKVEKFPFSNHHHHHQFNTNDNETTIMSSFSGIPQASLGEALFWDRDTNVSSSGL